MRLPRPVLLALAVAACTPSAPATDPSDLAPVRTATVGPARGSLVIVGGGAMGPEIHRRFLDLAGGPEQRIVVIPTAGEATSYPLNWSGLNGLKAAGATNLVLAHTVDRRVADSPDFVRAIDEARAVWLPGGRQWRLVDAYLGTNTQRALRRLLDRGGVIGGTSAGASILASYLVRGAREGNSTMMAPGYETGFGFLANSAIDQHVVARDRVPDLLPVIARHPKLLGLSLDEGTALIVQRDRAEVIGRGRAFAYGERVSPDAGLRWQTLYPGDVLDLATRRRILSATTDEPLPRPFLDSLFRDFDRQGEPGAAVLIAREGRVLYSLGYGSPTLGDTARINGRTNFRLASVSKAFTAMLVMRLEREGALRFDDVIGDHLDALKAPWARQVTIRHLLTHTSGVLAYENFVPDSATEQVSDADVLTLAATRMDSTYFAPGTKFRYSNTGYALLAMVVEKHAKRPIDVVLKQMIFDPLGMTNTLANREGESRIRFRAYNHSRRNGQWARTDQSTTSAVIGDGGIYSSVDEMYRWDQALYDGGPLDTVRLRAAFTAHRLPDSTSAGYGFGWFVDSYRRLPRVYHTGSTIGGRTVFVRFPTLRATIIILTNRADADPQQLAERIADRWLFSTGDARWQSQTVATAAGFRSLSAVNAQVAWAGGTRNTILRTVNGGSTWQVDSIRGAGPLDWRGLHAFSADTAVALSAGPAEEGQARIYRTVDGGRNWTLSWSDTTKGVFLDAVRFWDRHHGLAFSDPVDGRLFVLRTRDGGRSWSRIPPERFPSPLPNEAAFASSGSNIAVWGTKHAWIATGGGAQARVLRTTDGGESWTAHAAPYRGGTSAGFHAIAFADARNGLALAADYAIGRGTTDLALRTQDGGISWFPAGRMRPDGLATGLSYIPGARTPTFAAAGAYGTALTRDFGRSWIRGDTLSYYAISAAAPDALWAIGPRGRITKLLGRADDQ